MKNSKILGLRTVIYKVPNLVEAKEWYAKAFGTEAYFDKPFYVGFNIGGYELGLLPEEGIVVRWADAVAAYWGVQNISEAYEAMLKLGAKENEAPENVGGEIVTATVFDPWGNLIGLIYNPRFKLTEN